METTSPGTTTYSLPSELTRLRELAYNLRWSWNRPAADLFERIDPALWESTNHNPVLLLSTVDPGRLEAVAQDQTYLADLERASQDLEAYLADDNTWFRREHGDMGDTTIAYFSAEYGLTEALPIYSGGLGVLAADHLKSASDLGVPLVAIGLMYQHGYFRQYLDEGGWQRESYDVNDFEKLPLTLQRDADGNPLLVESPFSDRPVYAHVWRAQVGRVPLYLLDTNVSENRPEDRAITDQLYGGDIETRMRQEIVLGIGGYRALELLGVQPSVYHMNEGHNAFLALERVRSLMESRGLQFVEARRIAAESSVFTTHTPVAAGHDYFPPELVDRYLTEYREQLGLTRAEFFALGRHEPGNDQEYFCQTILALKMSTHNNGVSELHGHVSRQMWQDLYPGTTVDEVPIGHITNGVHMPSFVAPAVDALCERHVGSGWRQESPQALRERFERIPAADLWEIRTRQRKDLVAYARERLRAQLERRGVSASEVRSAADALDPDSLTIGFARRFATYKRATLLLRDPERLASILSNADRPVQLVFAGKAHPRDEGGKELIRRIVEMSRQEPFLGRLVFLEDYNIGVARRLVQGADVWLNNPLRPMEASGTSGMKAAANGVLNLSTLDGWWAEAWAASGTLPNPPGWAIGQGETYEDKELQDRLEAEALYDLLESGVVPLFYERDEQGLPQRWVERMKSAIYTVSPVYNTDRMLREYTEDFYLPAAAAGTR
ncbi:MAG: alpha-glucan family phosphorylase [Chloroflexota bacterium]|nr:alpha-glucan family phosphorylase [Chloroflexota bacterium]